MKSIVVDGQLSLFDEQPKVVSIIPTKEENKDNPIFKRKADNNVLIQYKNFCMAIYPNGHFAKWKSPAVYSDNEVYSIDEIEDINKINEEIEEDPKLEEVIEISESEEILRLGDKVKFNYDGPKEGNIVRIYNKGETVNVSWDNKQTAFYYKSVVKINA